jgi:biotin carboxyl carrier protein
MQCRLCTRQWARGAIDMMHVLRIGEASYAAALAGPPKARRLLLPDSSHDVSLTETADGACIIAVDGALFAAHVARGGDHCFVHIDGEVYAVAVLDPLAVHARTAAGAGGLEARAPMPGTVVALPVSEGAAVQAGDTLVIIESMKLELAIKAECAGTVAAIHCSVGGTFDKDAVLLTLAAAGEG